MNNRKMEKVSSAEEWKKYEYTFKMPEKTSKVVVHIKMNGVIDLDNAYLGPADLLFPLYSIHALCLEKRHSALSDYIDSFYH